MPRLERNHPDREGAVATLFAHDQPGPAGEIDTLTHFRHGFVTFDAKTT
jgi:hypothetical protein